MELGDLFEVLVALAVVMAGLLSGGKKKKKPQQPARRGPAPEARRPAARPPGAKPAPKPAPQPSWDMHQSTGSDRLMEDLRRLEATRGEVVTEMPEAYSLETFERKDVSLETLVPAGGASHERFHEQYVQPLDPVRARQVRASRPPGGLRAAVIWAEILGPPKGLQ